MDHRKEIIMKRNLNVKTINLPEPPPGKLGKWDLYALAVGTVIGAGIVTLVGPAIAATGYSVWLAYIVALVFGLFYAAPVILLSSAMRLSGSEYSIVAGLIGPLPAGVLAVGRLTSGLLLALFGTSFGVYVNSVFPFISIRTAAIATLTFFYIVNLFGINIMAKVQKAMTWLLIVALLMFSIVGLFKIEYPVFDFSAPTFFANGFSGFFTAVMLLYFSCTGYYTTMAYGRDAKNATKDIPWAMLLTFGTIFVLYTLVAIVSAGVLPMDQTAGQPLTALAKHVLPAPLFFAFMICGPVLALATSINGAIANIPYGLSQQCFDGWFPQSFATKNKYGAYWKILTFTYIISVLPVLLGFSVTIITNNMMLFNSCLSFLLIYAYYRLPTKFPTGWKNSSLHVPNALYYVIITGSLAVNLIAFFQSMASLTTTIITVSLAIMVFALVYTIVRNHKAEVVINTSIWEKTVSPVEQSKN